MKVNSSISPLVWVLSLDFLYNLLNGRYVAFPDDIIKVWELDLHSYGSIVTFVKRDKAFERLDIVILNTAVSKQDYDIILVMDHKEII
jgi:hypothetical protein